MLHAIICQGCQKWALYEQFFVTVSQLADQIFYLTSDSCAKSKTESFDAHNGHIARIDLKITAILPILPVF